MELGNKSGYNQSCFLCAKIKILLLLCDMHRNSPLAGTETTSTFIEWSLVFLMMYPKIQDKIAREIQEVACSRRISLTDRHKAHYTNATVEEMARMIPGDNNHRL